MTESPLPSLAEARRTHYGALAVAAHVWRLLNELHGVPVLLDGRKLINAATLSIFSSASYVERFETYEDCEAFVAKRLDEVLTCDMSSGAPRYRVFAFFAEEPFPFYERVGLGYLRGCARSELALLDVASSLAALGPDPRFDAPVSGLSDAEYSVLVAHYTRETLTLVNRLRHASTALAYIRFKVEHPEPIADVLVDGALPEAVGPLVSALEHALALPWDPAPARWFGTEADRINPLRTLTPTLIAALRACADSR
jgi:hypothetical protein